MLFLKFPLSGYLHIAEIIGSKSLQSLLEALLSYNL